MLLDTRDRKIRRMAVHRFHDVSHIKLMDIFKSFRHRRLQKHSSHRTSLTRSRIHSPLTDHDISPVPPLPSSQSQILASTSSSSLYALYSHSDAGSILSNSEGRHSFGMNVSFSAIDQTPDLKKGGHYYPLPVPLLPSSASAFQLRSETTKDYLVERLEQHLRRLSLTDASPGSLASSVGRVIPPEEVVLDIPMDVYLEGQNQSPLVRREVNPALSEERIPRSLDLTSFSEETVIPMIVITSADAKNVRPLPPSVPRPSRAPFRQSDLTNLHNKNEPQKSKRQMSSDDPFTTPPNCAAYSPDHSFAFRLPSYPPIYANASHYSPETPTPMNCSHFGDCGGDMWEVWHPPLVYGQFTLPPFELPPLGVGIFDEMLVSQH